ncbi:hypothetical protein FB451DRAFT_1164155 [Mycena latifolia]|nr:hypothetical protein FB451DRAFT_1164155 [Mycena latifolia]
MPPAAGVPLASFGEQSLCGKAPTIRQTEWQQAYDASQGSNPYPAPDNSQSSKGIRWETVMTPGKTAARMQEKAETPLPAGSSLTLPLPVRGADLTGPSQAPNMQPFSYFAQAGWRMPHSWSYPHNQQPVVPQYPPHLWKAQPLPPSQHPQPQPQAYKHRKPREPLGPRPQASSVLRPPPLPRVAPPLPRIVLPLVDGISDVDPPDPIVFQTLDLLVADLRRLLCTPHEEQPFYFRGTYSIVADPAIGHAARIISVAWALIRGTPVSFNAGLFEHGDRHDAVIRHLDERTAGSTSQGHGAAPVRALRAPAHDQRRARRLCAFARPPGPADRRGAATLPDVDVPGGRFLGDSTGGMEEESALSRMHRGLEILDIVELICEQVGTPTCGCTKRHLSALARTATIFHPALNILWRDQYTIKNVLRCMPDDLWDITNTGDIFDTVRIRLLRVITPSDWERPLFYLHRVKSFHMDDFFEDARFFEALSFCPPGEFIFPNLERLYWFPRPLESFHNVRMFLSPSIKQITLGSISTIPHLTVLSTLAVKCPSLVNITIYITTGIQGLSLPVVSRFIRSLGPIESLLVPALDEAAFAHLAQLPSLQSLSLSNPQTAENIPELPADAAAFESLTELTVSTMEYATALLAMMATRPFVALMVRRPSEAHTQATARQFYLTVAKHCSPSSLRRICIYGAEGNMDPLTANQIATCSAGGDILSPLFSFTNLVHVDLVHSAGWNLDNPTVLAMARAWPRIEYLALEAGDLRHIRSRVTLEGLSAFAKHCPNLRRLEMTLDATVRPTIRKNGKQERMSYAALTCLKVALSPIKGPRHAAKFLSAIFPLLVETPTSYDDLLRDLDEDDEEELEVADDVADNHFRWKKVEEYLHEFHHH